MPNFTPSSVVTRLVSGKTRDDSFDDAVRQAWQLKDSDKPVLEELVADKATADEYRKGLFRSAKYLADTGEIAVRVSMLFEEITEGRNAGQWWVRFSAAQKRRTPRRNADGTGDAGYVESDEEYATEVTPETETETETPEVATESTEKPRRNRRSETPAE